MIPRGEKEPEVVRVRDQAAANATKPSCPRCGAQAGTYEIMARHLATCDGPQAVAAVTATAVTATASTSRALKFAVGTRVVIDLAKARDLPHCDTWLGYKGWTLEVTGLQYRRGPTRDPLMGHFDNEVLVRLRDTEGRGSGYWAPEKLLMEADGASRAPVVQPPTTETDMVNSPAHYVSGGLEVIDVLEAFDLDKDFCLGNAVKYVLRAGRKDPAKFVEDLKKAEYYIKRRIRNAEKERKK